MSGFSNFSTHKVVTTVDVIDGKVVRDIPFSESHWFPLGGGSTLHAIRPTGREDGRWEVSAFLEGTSWNDYEVDQIVTALTDTIENLMANRSTTAPDPASRV